MKTCPALIIMLLLSISSPSMAGNDPFGLHGANGDIEASQELGVRQLRVAALTWGVIEPEKGRYDFAGIDRGVRKLQAAGMDLIVATIRNINRWGGNQRAQKGYQRGSPLTLNSGFPSDIEAWKKFIHTVVERYDGDGVDDMPGLKYPLRYWQIEGEWMWQWKDTTENYLRFLDISYREIKRADAEALVISGAVTGGIAFALGEGLDKRGYFEKGGGPEGSQRVPKARLVKSGKYKKAIKKARFFLREAKDSFDIVDIHLYSRDAYSIPPSVDWLRSTMEGYGYSKPIWSLENAGPFYGYSEQAQAQEVVKRYVLAISSGMEKLFWSSLHETKGWADKFLNLSLIDDSGRKKPAFFTYKLLVSKIDGFDNFERLDMGEGVYAFKVTRQGAVIYVLWSEKGQPASLSVGAQKLRVTETVSLKVRNEKARRGVLTIKLGKAPVIIEEL